MRFCRPSPSFLPTFNKASSSWAVPTPCGSLDAILADTYRHRYQPHTIPPGNQATEAKGGAIRSLVGGSA